MGEHSTESSGLSLDRYAVVTLFACAYAVVIGPFLLSGDPSPSTAMDIQNGAPSLVSRIFVPAIAAVAVVMAIQNHDRLRRWPSHLVCLLAYVTFAGASILWAFRPEASFVRFAQQVMLLSSIVLPAMLATRTADLMRGVFLCFAAGAVLNVVFGYQTPIGYAGYLPGKNALGQFSGMALLLAIHELLYPGFRRLFGIVIVGVAFLLLSWSDSKTAFALALVSPMLAGLVLLFTKITRASPAIAIMTALILYVGLSSFYDFDAINISNVLYNDPTLTGRTHIWNFAFSEIAQRPVLGWGYQSFWLVGSDAPSVVEAPGWVANMPNAHNGYFDTILELGYVGLGLLMLFIFTTLHRLACVADLRKFWLLLSIALYVILYNGLETIWMHASEPLWVVFVIVAVEIGRHAQPAAAEMPMPAQRFAPSGPYRPS
ncbi:O-antigen ligase family protein [Bradyrhizobium sp.]|uniref:O-antigen ligase family protein n=1 Tax=Bradyrhizobium sp. TaxID=376 RepID=UPI0039E22B30